MCPCLHLSYVAQQPAVLVLQFLTAMTYFCLYASAKVMCLAAVVQASNGVMGEGIGGTVVLMLYLAWEYGVLLGLRVWVGGNWRGYTLGLYGMATSLFMFSIGTRLARHRQQ